MLYEWNTRKWVEDFLNLVVRKPRTVALYHAFIAPASTFFQQFLNFKKDIDRKVKYNGQVIRFEAALNDLFDPVLKRIYIVTNGDQVEVYTYQRSENKPKYSRNRTEGGLITIRSRSEISAGLDADFVVYVPAAIVAANEQLINAWIKFYKLSTKTYLIKSI